jgi:hypothetical protein
MCTEPTCDMHISGQYAVQTGVQAGHIQIDIIFSFLTIRLIMVWYGGKKLKVYGITLLFVCLYAYPYA